jgi:outer membrane receptor protein involved in Fe transport
MRKCHVLLCLLASVDGQAQTETSVSGRIVGADSSAPVPFATVTVVSQNDGLPLTEVLADEEGRFVVSGLPDGRFRVRATSLGYVAADRALLIGALNDIYDLGDIALSPVDEGVEELLVTARQEILGATLDRRVFSMADNIAGQTGSMLDALRSLPGVAIDQEGRVLLRGSDRVSILIDGKYSSLTGYGSQSSLDGVPAANIDRIEIINNPSAAYDAAGMAGIINIVYREDLETGLNIEGGVTFGAGTLSKQKPDLPTELGSFSTNPKLIPSLDLSLNSPERRVFLQSEFLFQDDIPNNEFTTRFYDDGRVILSQVPENREQDQYIINAGLDRYLDDSRTFSVSGVLDFETHTDIAQVPFIDAATMMRNRYWYWREKEDTGYLNLAFGYEHEFVEPGHELRMSLQYTRGWEDEAYFLNEVSPVRVGTDMTHLDAKENTLPFQIDYVRPLASGRLESGARLQRRWIPVTYEVERGEGSVIYDGLGDWSDWSESIYAGYANYVHERERYAVEAGARIEQTDVTYDLPPENVYYPQSDAYDYFEVYPNIRLTYKLSDRNSVAGHYNNRVDRPGEPELRIFPKYDDPELLKVGNPYLRPQFTESFELSFEHLWASGSAIISAYHRDIKDPFVRVYAIDPTNTDYDIINKIYQNVGSGNDLGLELVLSQDVRPNWELTGSINWYEHTIDADRVTLLFPVERPFDVEYSSDSTWDLTLNNSITFTSGARLQLAVVYYADRNIAQGRQLARSSVDIGFSQPVLRGRGDLLFSLTDAFNDFAVKQQIRGEGFSALYENYFETQVLRVGINYQFQ